MDSTTNIFKHRVLQLFSHNVEAAHAIKRSQKQQGWRFCRFHRLEVKETGLDLYGLQLYVAGNSRVVNRHLPLK